MVKEYLGDIKSVEDLLTNIEKSGLMASKQAHLRIWFRGQVGAFDLVPGVYRKNFNAVDEGERLNKEQHLSQDFRVLSARLVPSTTNDADRYFLQQHYGMPTRLLDWSYSPMSALYFASLSDDNNDGELYIMDAYQLATTQGVSNKIFQGIATSRHPIFQETIKVILGWQTYDKFHNFIIPVRPDLSDTRFDLQKGCFTFHVPKNSTLTEGQNKTLKVFRIPGDAKKNIRSQLSLIGVNAFNIFNDLDNLAKTLKEQYDIG